MATSENNKKVLLVDDGQGLSGLESALLKRTGAAILTARNGQEALQLVEKEKPNIVLLDLKLPDINGADVCWRIKTNSRLNPSPIVMVASSADQESYERCRKAFCDELVPTPIKQQQLLNRLTELLNIPHRHSIRILVRVETVDRPDSSGVVFGTSADISRSGMLLEVEQRLEPGQRLMLRFFLPGQHEIAVQAEIMRTELRPPKKAYGLRFLEMAPESQKFLNEFVESRKK